MGERWRGRTWSAPLSVLSEPLGKSMTHCPNCDSRCRILIAPGPSAQDHPQPVATVFSQTALLPLGAAAAASLLFATFLHSLQFSGEQFIIICWRNRLECRSFDPVVFSALHLFRISATLLPRSHYLGTAGDASTL